MTPGSGALTASPPESTAFTPPNSLLRDQSDARLYVRWTLTYVLLLYAALGLASWAIIPAWTLAAIVPLAYLRLALALHELLHVRSAGEVPFFHRLTMIFETPMCLGYREHRAIHFAHHRFASTERDPERYQIVGSPWRAFGNALISPERGCYHWVRAHGLSRTLAIEGGLRLSGFIAVASINPPVFLIYWIALRLSVGVAAFVFHHVLHNDRGRLGTLRPPLSSGLVRAAGLFFGAEPLLIITEHERHHEWPRVRARDLPLLPEPRA